MATITLINKIEINTIENKQELFELLKGDKQFIFVTKKELRPAKYENGEFIHRKHSCKIALNKAHIVIIF